MSDAFWKGYGSLAEPWVLWIESILTMFKPKPKCEHDFEKVVIKPRNVQQGPFLMMYGGRTLYLCRKCGEHKP